jgi:hypothetical protein
VRIPSGVLEQRHIVTTRQGCRHLDPSLGCLGSEGSPSERYWGLVGNVRRTMKSMKRLCNRPTSLHTNKGHEMVAS